MEISKLQVRTSTLEVAYEQTGPSGGPPVLLLHGFPYDVAGDPALEELENRLAEKPKIHVPAVTVRGADDRVEPAAGTESEASQFTGYYDRRVLAGVGHCIPAEAPKEIAAAIEDVLRRR